MALRNSGFSERPSAERTAVLLLRLGTCETRARNPKHALNEGILCKVARCANGSPRSSQNGSPTARSRWVQPRLRAVYVGHAGSSLRSAAALWFPTQCWSCSLGNPSRGRLLQHAELSVSAHHFGLSVIPINFGFIPNTLTWITSAMRRRQDPPGLLAQHRLVWSLLLPNMVFPRV